MRLLLDTHAFLWWTEGSPELSKKARSAVAEAEVCFASLVSAWELAIKVRLGKLKLALPVRRYFPEHISANDFTQLDITFPHVARVETLELHHGDPFDRLLAAQALEEQLAIVSADPIFKSYGVRRIW